MKMIAAVGRNYEIGRGNELPWRCPSDLKLFRSSPQTPQSLWAERQWKVLSARFRSATTSF